MKTKGNFVYFVDGKIGLKIGVWRMPTFDPPSKDVLLSFEAPESVNHDGLLLDFIIRLALRN